MRTVTQSYEVYKLNELKGVNYRNAIEAVSRQRTEDWIELESHDLVRAMEEAADYFGLRVTDYSIGLFDRSYVSVDRGYEDKEREAEMVEYLEAYVPKGTDGLCPFTGVYFDGYFFDYFKEYGIPTTEDVREEIAKAIAYMLERSIDDAERSILDDDYSLTYADEEELEFHEDGAIHH